jgi:hypothetical protein
VIHSPIGKFYEFSAGFLNRTEVAAAFHGKMKTDHVDAHQIGDVREHWKGHSPSGEMVADTFTDYLCKLREHAGTEQKIILIRDLHASH